MNKNKWMILFSVALCPFSLYWALTAPTQNVAVLLGFLSGTNAIGALMLIALSIATDKLEKQRVEIEAELESLLKVREMSLEEYSRNFEDIMKDLTK